MNVAQMLALTGVAMACGVLFVVMRYPGMRRMQFQGGKTFSVAVSLACALGVFVLFAFLILRLQE